jgi:hypothetical protein
LEWTKLEHVFVLRFEPYRTQFAHSIRADLEAKVDEWENKALANVANGGSPQANDAEYSQPKQQPIPKGHAKSKNKAKNTLPYSQADDALYKHIGDEGFELYNNAELERQYRVTAQKKFNHDYPKGTDGFRSRLNRIRRHHKLPSSKEIRSKKS